MRCLEQDLCGELSADGIKISDLLKVLALKHVYSNVKSSNKYSYDLI